MCTFTSGEKSGDVLALAKLAARKFIELLKENNGGPQ